MTAARAIDLETTPGLPDWLAARGISLAFTSYRTGDVFVLGQDGGRPTASACGLPRAMGLGAGRNGFWAAALPRLWRFENFVPPGQRHEGHDAVYVPLTAHTTGAVDVHDIAEGPDGAPVFVATRMNCLARLAAGHSFAEVWRPPFVDRLIAEDRCHLNGVATAAGVPRFATCVAATNASGAWRDQRRDGGLVLDVPAGRVVLRGLSMPHSPRLWGGWLWLLDSGTGRLLRVDPAGGAAATVCALPGFARGLAVQDGVAIAGTSLPRAESGFDGLPLSDLLARAGRAPECALHVIDLGSGERIHRVAIGPGVEEIYDVAILPGVSNPRLVGPEDEDLQFLLRPLAATGRP